MDEKEYRALKRVMKKLSNLKATLRKDEARLLDQLIFGDQEVQLHSAQGQGQFRILQGAQPSAAKGAQPRKNPAAQPRTQESASEMALHSMTPRPSGRKNPSSTPGASPRKQDAGSEIVLHSMKSRPSGRKTPSSTPGASPRKQDAASEIVLHSIQPAGRISNQAAKGIVARISVSAQGEYSVTNMADR
jgi:hypothetical protein